MNNIKNLVLIALFVALFTVGAYIKIPLPFVPITLQYAFVALCGLILGAKLGALSVLVYIFMGLLGIPVFSSGGGFSYVLFPTFGYLIGFFFGVITIGLIAHSSPVPSFKRMLLAAICGLFVVYFFGTLYFFIIKTAYMGDSVTASYLLINCFLIFLPSDITFSVLGVIVARKMRPILIKQGMGAYYNRKAA